MAGLLTQGAAATSTALPQESRVTPMSATPAAGTSAGTGTSPIVSKPPTVPSLSSLYPTTPTASTLSSSSAGAAPKATASDVGTVPNASSENVNLAGLNANGQYNSSDSTNAAAQLGSITGQNSPLMQQAAQQGYLSAAARGLGNSSIAAGNTEAAMTAAATPLAEQNAQEAAAGAEENAQLGTQASEFNASQALQKGETNAQLNTQTSQANATLAAQTNQFNASQQQAAASQNAQAQNQIKAQTEQLQEQINQQFLSGTQSMDLASIQGQYNQLISTNQTAASLYNSYLTGISNIMANQNISPDRVAESITAQQSMLESGLAIINELNGGSTLTPGQIAGSAPGGGIYSGTSPFTTPYTPGGGQKTLP